MEEIFLQGLLQSAEEIHIGRAGESVAPWAVKTSCLDCRVIEIVYTTECVAVKLSKKGKKDLKERIEQVRAQNPRSNKIAEQNDEEVENLGAIVFPLNFVSQRQPLVKVKRLRGGRINPDDHSKAESTYLHNAPLGIDLLDILELLPPSCKIVLRENEFQHVGIREERRA